MALTLQHHIRSDGDPCFSSRPSFWVTFFIFTKTYIQIQKAKPRSDWLAILCSIDNLPFSEKKIKWKVALLNGTNDMKSFNFPNISSQNFKTFYCDRFRKHSDCLHCNVFKLRPDRVGKNNRSYRSMEKKILRSHWKYYYYKSKEMFKSIFVSTHI